jgi:hypothetical protein
MEGFKTITNAVSKSVSALGFKKINQSAFAIKEGNNWGVINFQKSQSNTKSEVRFTINLDIFSGAIRDFLEGEKVNSAPKTGGSHWNKRIGFLLPEKKDYWWTITDATNIAVLEKEITAMVSSIAVEEIKKNLSDANLINQWKEAVSPGITEFQRLQYLAILMKFTGQPDYTDAANQLLAYSSGKSISMVAKGILQLLDSPNPFPQE